MSSSLKAKLIWLLILAVCIGVMIAVNIFANSTTPHPAGCGCGGH